MLNSSFAHFSHFVSYLLQSLWNQRYIWAYIKLKERKSKLIFLFLTFISLKPLIYTKYILNIFPFPGQKKKIAFTYACPVPPFLVTLLLIQDNYSHPLDILFLFTLFLALISTSANLLLLLLALISLFYLSLLSP